MEKKKTKTQIERFEAVKENVVTFLVDCKTTEKSLGYKVRQIAKAIEAGNSDFLRV